MTFSHSRIQIPGRVEGDTISPVEAEEARHPTPPIENAGSYERLHSSSEGVLLGKSFSRFARFQHRNRVDTSNTGSDTPERRMDVQDSQDSVTLAVYRLLRLRNLTSHDFPHPV